MAIMITLTTIMATGIIRMGIVITDSVTIVSLGNVMSGANTMREATGSAADTMAEASIRSVVKIS